MEGEGAEEESKEIGKRERGEGERGIWGGGGIREGGETREEREKSPRGGGERCKRNIRRRRWR